MTGYPGKFSLWRNDLDDLDAIPHNCGVVAARAALVEGHTEPAHRSIRMPIFGFVALGAISEIPLHSRHLPRRREHEELHRLANLHASRVGLEPCDRGIFKYTWVLQTAGIDLLDFYTTIGEQLGLKAQRVPRNQDTAVRMNKVTRERLDFLPVPHSSLL